jgi:branched-subunit amino acid ABC-type transport system permease component
MLFWQILIDGFAISSLYALGATGFALIFGVSGVLNLSHGALMVAAHAATTAATISAPWDRLSTPETPKISANPVAPSA